MDEQSPTTTERRCPICGSIIPAGARFCPSCGNRQPDHEAAAPSFSAALDDILVDDPIEPAAEPTIVTPPTSVWGPNEPVDPFEETRVPAEPVAYQPSPAPQPVASLPAQPGQPTGYGEPSSPAGWATTPGHWTNQEEPPLKQQGWRGNRTLWLVLGIIGIIVFCCCGFFFIVSAISAAETSAAIEILDVAYRIGVAVPRIAS